MQLALLTWKDCLFKAMHTQVCCTAIEKGVLFCGIGSITFDVTSKSGSCLLRVWYLKFLVGIQFSDFGE